MKQRIGIITSGGDCAGLNAVISAAVKSGRTDYDFIGFQRGWEGLLDKEFIELDTDRIRGISHLGGTILRTTNKGRFGAKQGAGDANAIDPEMLQLAKRNCDELELHALLVLGGDGTLSGALQLAELGVNIVGIPKTIDNDLSSTDKTFGFSTAVQIAVDALDKIHTTATSHDRTFLVECMGRNAGWISLYAGLAASANAILLPEFDFDLDNFVNFLRQRNQPKTRSTIVVVAEGIRLQDRQFKQLGTTEHSYVGASETLMQALEATAPGEFEMRNVILGHTQRGGTPSSQDRILAKRYGVAATQAVRDGKFGQMVRVRGNLMETASIAEAVGELKLVTPNSYEYQAAKQLGIYIN
jgi:6-phosphofructokinase 1